jgi:membrane-associated phospholipid phosphatase
LYKKKRFDDLDKVVFAYLSTYYISYIIYFFVPALGPRFNDTLTGLQTIKELDGIVLAVPIRELINFLEPNKFDAFPSLHTAILTITMLGCYYYHRKLFKIFIPVAIGILISLVYCRYHYVVDMIAGFVIALISYYVSGFLYGILKRKTGIVPFVK